MFRQLKNDWKLYGGYVAISPLLALIGGIIGSTLVYFIVGEEDPVWPCIGTIMALFMVGIVCTTIVSAQFASELCMAITMGCTRRHVFASFLIRSLAMYAAGYVVILLVNAVEVGLVLSIDPTRDWLPTMAQLLDWRWVLGVLLLLMLLPPCCALLVQRFGKPASVTLWVVWMMCCILPSRLVDNDMLDWVMTVPVFWWWGMYALVMAALGITTFVLMKRYTVR